MFTPEVRDRRKSWAQEIDGRGEVDKVDGGLGDEKDQNAVEVTGRIG